MQTVMSVAWTLLLGDLRPLVPETGFPELRVESSQERRKVLENLLPYKTQQWLQRKCKQVAASPERGNSQFREEMIGGRFIKEFAFE